MQAALCTPCPSTIDGEATTLTNLLATKQGTSLSEGTNCFVVVGAHYDSINAKAAPAAEFQELPGLGVRGHRCKRALTCKRLFNVEDLRL